MPTTSKPQHRLMEWAAHTPGGVTTKKGSHIPQSVGREFVNADKRVNKPRQRTPRGR